MNTTENKNPIITESVNLSYTKGEYSFFTKSVARLVIIALAILRACGSIVTGRPAAELVNCLWIVHHMANKLEGIDSVSSSVHDNCFCKRWRTQYSQWYYLAQRSHSGCRLQTFILYLSLYPDRIVWRRCQRHSGPQLYTDYKSFSGQALRDMVKKPCDMGPGDKSGRQTEKYDVCCELAVYE